MRKAITLLSAAALFAAQGQAQVENSEWKDMAGSGYLWSSTKTAIYGHQAPMVMDK
jgi:hypothetical protein